MARKKTFTIEAALDGALELFSERGYHGTSMQAIAEHMKLKPEQHLRYVSRQGSAVRAGVTAVHGSGASVWG